MGKGRAPCCDKNQVKRGPWSPAEDLRLITYIQKHGHENWRALPKLAGLLRCGKSCRLRWINYLRPDVKRGNFTQEEEDTIIKLHQALGNKWSKIASHLPGRTDNEIKNVWNTHLKKRLALKEPDQTLESKESCITSSSSSSDSFEKGISGAGNGFPLAQNMFKNSPGGQNQFITPAAVSEPMKPSSSAVSYDSNSYTSAVSKMEKQQIDPMFEMGYNLIVPGNSPLLPLECDTEFWSMLESIDCGNPKEIQLRLPECSYTRPECNRESENRKWLRYLETELELDDTTMAKCMEIPAAPEAFPGEFWTKPMSSASGPFCPMCSCSLPPQPTMGRRY